MFYLYFDAQTSPSHALSVAGLSLIKRATISAQKAGFDSITICLDDAFQEAAKEDLSGDKRVSASIEWTSQLNLSSTVPDEEAVVALGNRVWTSAAINACKAPLDGGTKMRVPMDAATDQPAGLFRLRACQLEKLDFTNNVTIEQLRALWPNDDDAVELVPLENAIRVVDSNADIHAAETVLLRSLIKDTDGVISRNINRKISLALSRRLARTNTTPNQITVVVLLVGLLSGPFAFFMDSYLGFLLGGLCLYLSAILDGCDGELSRLKYCGSPLGAWLDTVTDDVVCLSYILGLYGRLALNNPGPFWLWTGIIGVAFYLLTILPRYWVMAVRLKSGNYQLLAAQKSPEKVEGFAKVFEGVRNVIFRTDFIPFYAFATAAVGFVPAFAIPFAIGSIASAIDTAITVATPFEAAQTD